MSAMMQMMLANGASFGVGGTWSLVGASTATTGDNPVITLPSGIASGDLILISVSAYLASSVTASGYSVAYSNYNSGTFDLDAVLLYKIATGTEGGTTVSVSTGSAGASSGATVYRPSGTASLGPTAGTERSNNETVTSPTLIIDKDALIIIFDAFRRPANTCSISSAPSGVTARHNIAGTITNAGFWLGDVYAESSPTTAYVGTITYSSNNESIAVAVAFYSS